MNGTLIDHLPDGEWIIMIDSVETDTTVIEGVRTTIIVSEQTANDAQTISTSLNLHHSLLKFLMLMELIWKIWNYN